ncbi:MAG: Rne/Rng family ribonuclease [Acetobacteraceae bacterium]
MTKRMLIDATHAEETRVVVLDGNRLEDFDVETSAKRHLKGNIYLAKVVRVEPSLQAAFVEYGGNRHGFLAFSEIHPDYYQIPVADRQRLIEMEAEEARREEEEDELELALNGAADDIDDEPADPRGAQPLIIKQPVLTGEVPAVEPVAHWALAAFPPLTAAAAAAPAWADATRPSLIAPAEAAADAPTARAASRSTAAPSPDLPPPALRAALPPAPAWADASRPGLLAPPLPIPAWALAAQPPLLAAAPAETALEFPRPAESGAEAPDERGRFDRRNRSRRTRRPQPAPAPAVPEPQPEVTEDDEPNDELGLGEAIAEAPPPEVVGGEQDSVDEPRERRLPPRFLRNYKIQEVIRRRQIMLVQVVKEERGTKGAALTTYLSLAGRFAVLMPNSPRGGGISRKITSATDRRRLKEIMTELDLPRGMGLIIRTAGAARPKPEIKRDCEYLLRLWDDIRDHTMKSIAPALIYEEASLIKRAIRDVYSRDIDEILVDGEDGWRAAHDFMRMLMPSHARKVQLWRDAAGSGSPLFTRHQVEAQLDAMLMPIVQLRSGGYLVINQAEALVAIDVNSGRSTRERNIEETALRTNLEAADEVARQLRLRDLAGLIVIDFIDMESKRHNAMVERRLKDALKNDRARIQVGHISHFGLLEMSRQRLRPSLAETNFVTCPHCGGTGHVRSTENAAIHVLRGIEEEGSKRRAAEVVVHVSTPVALYLLNHKRDRLREIEMRYMMRVIIAADDAQVVPLFRIERVRPQIAGEVVAVITPDLPAPVPIPVPAIAAPEPEEAESIALDEDEAPDDADEAGDEEQAEDLRADGSDSDEADRRRRRRRRRRRGRREDGTAAGEDEAGETEAGEAADAQELALTPAAPEPAEIAPVAAVEPDVEAVPEVTAADLATDGAIEGVPERAEAETDDDARGRRRGRRGGRRRRRESDDELSPLGLPGAEQPELVPAYSGPTPANPFGDHVYDIFDVMEQAERGNETGRPKAAEMPAHQPATSHGEPAAADLPADPDILTPGAEAPAESPPADSLVELEAPSAVPGSEPAAGTAPDMEPEPVVSVDTGTEAPAVVVDDAILAQTIVEAVAPAAAVSVHPSTETSADMTPASTPEPVMAEAATAETTVPAPANDEPAEPLVKPIVIGTETAPVEKKRGWWRR